MPSVSDFKVGQGIQWTICAAGKPVHRYGLIIGNDDASLRAVQVDKLDRNVKCYDEGGADPDTDLHNVRLRHCTDTRGPFTGLCGDSDRNGCYAYANPARVMSVSNTFIKFHHIEVLDDGVTAHEDDIQEVIDHVWRDERQAGSGPAVQQTAARKFAGTGRRFLGGRRPSDDVPEPEEGLTAVEVVGRRRDKAVQLEELARKQARRQAGPERDQAAPAQEEPSLKSRTAALEITRKPPDTGHGGLGE